MKEIYFLTGNESKLNEARKFIPEIKSLKLDLQEIQSIDPYKIIKFKLEEAKKFHNGNFIVEDTSLIINCLNGLPGPLIRWFEETIGLNGIVKIINSYNDNKAVAKCTIGLNFNGKTEFFEGIINGKIVSPKGNNGFGWDKIFIPDNYKTTFAEMSNEEKNKISHRKLAFEKLKNYLENEHTKN